MSALQRGWQLVSVSRQLAIAKAFGFVNGVPSRYGEAVDRVYRRKRWRVLLAITLGYGFIYTCRLALGIVKKPLIDAGIFTPSELGFIGSALFYAYAVGKFTNGFLADHLKIRPFVVAGFAGTALANLIMWRTHAAWVAALVWGLNGWFQSFGAPACVVTMTAWFSNRERGRAYGVWSTSHSIGEGMTFLCVSSAVAAWGWQAGFLIPSIIGLITAAGMYVLIRGRPVDVGLPPVAEWQGEAAMSSAPRQKTTLALQLSILRIPEIWVLAIASALAYIARYAINSWGVLYLQEAKGLSLSMAGTLLMLNTVSGAVGAIAYGFVSDSVFASRRPPANLIFALLEIIGLALVFWGPNSLYVLAVGMLLFGLGMAGLVASLGGLFAVDIAPKRAAGAALGFIGVFSYLGSALQEQISGQLIESGMTTTAAGRHYDFDTVVLFWLGASIASMLAAALLWRSRLRD